MSVTINEADKVEILSLQDNYIDLAAMDGNEMCQRAIPLKGMEFSNSIIAEHGFSAIITVTSGGQSRSILFDFGFSKNGAARNADNLNVDLTTVEALALSHGHTDHTGGFEELVRKIGKPNIPFVAHPEAFRIPRFLKIAEDFKINLPCLSRQKIKDLDVNLIESAEPYPLLDGSLLFLGEPPRKTKFEKGMKMAYYEENGEEKWDSIPDDTAIVANVKGKGLVVLSGCAHAGIVNTVKYASEVTGNNKIFAVMGGFHLTGPDFEPIIEPTTEGLKEIDPEFVIPTHCTGRKAITHIEKEMPEKFLLNMVGTKMIFSA